MSTRDRIIACALTAFSRKGYDAVGIQEIVDAAEVTKPTLYHYFSSKLGLLDTLLAEGGAALKTTIGAGAIYRGDLVKNLQDLARAAFDFAQTHREFYRLLLAMTHYPPENESHAVVSAFQESLFGALEALFKAAEQDHGNMRGRSAQYALSFLGLLHTYAGLLVDGRLPEAADLPYRVTHQYMHGIFS